MDKPAKEDYRHLIDSEWRDIHHSRLQEWSALGVISGLHVGIIALIDTFRGLPPEGVTTLVLFATLSGVVFSVIGILLTMRHRRLMNIKMGWIYAAEVNLGLIKTEQNPDGIIPTQQQDVREKKK